ncbi:MAG: zf-TFIIB domain-containing protein [Gammaproteobacteria bacterium]|nr:zf-TFIIB domain-containing protein [Gammaproteobacteria bacterium]
MHWLTGAQLARLLQQRGELETFVAKAERALTSNTRRACPQCRLVLLQSTKIDDVTLDYCLRCGGTLFDYQELNTLYKGVLKLDVGELFADGLQAIALVRIAWQILAKLRQ